MRIMFVEYSYDKQSEDSILCSLNITDISKTNEFIVMARYNNMIESMVEEYVNNRIENII